MEEGLRKLAAGCDARRCDEKAVLERIGRLKEINRRSAGLFDIQVTKHETDRVRVTWQKREDWRAWATLSEGCYLLRTNILDWSSQDSWRSYIHLTDAEEAFRIHKQDLAIRPIWHRTEHRAEAHVLVCFLAYVVWKTLGNLCRQVGLGDEPRRIFAEMAQIQTVDVIMPTKQGIELKKRCITRPTSHQEILLSKLSLTIPLHLKPMAL